MTKVCICQICTCGRHRCPHNPQGIPHGDAPCTISEYNNKYTSHPIEMRKSFKPTDKPVARDGLMDDKTTHRVDYVPHPLGQHFVHQGDKYKQPEGDMDMMTNYHKEFTQKPIDPVKSQRKEHTRLLPGRFEGEPTYKADYRKWGVQPRERVTADSTYLAPTVPFEGNSNYQTDYTPHRQAVRQSMRPNEAPRTSDQPFDDATDYKQSYVKYPMPERFQRERPVYQANTAPLDDLSNYRKDYTEKGAGKQASCKPDNKPYHSVAPFDGDTTQKTDYIPWPTERPFMHEHERYKKPEGDMMMNTTTHTDYDRKPIERHLATRPQEMKKVPGKFDGTTNYREEYRKWAPGERPQQTMRDQYVPNEAPFEGQPTYQRDYVTHRAAMTRSLKPIDPGYSSGAPLDDNTEYKQEYTRKQAPMCPAIALINNADIGYTFREQDPSGHKWYEPGVKPSSPQMRLQPIVN